MIGTKIIVLSYLIINMAAGLIGLANGDDGKSRATGLIWSIWTFTIFFLLYLK